MKELKNMLRGDLYKAQGDTIETMRKDLLDKLHSYNHLPYNDFKSRDKLILDILGKGGKKHKNYTTSIF